MLVEMRNQIGEKHNSSHSSGIRTEFLGPLEKHLGMGRADRPPLLASLGRQRDRRGGGTKMVFRAASNTS